MSSSPSSPTGGVSTVEEFESLLIRGGDQQIYLRDVATVRRGYVEPQNNSIRYDGNYAIGLGISTVSGGNVVVMGEAISTRMKELMEEIPLGIEFGIVSLQSQAVATAISGFVISLVEAVAIVIVVLLFFMGVRSGLLIGFVLVLTIMGSFIFLSQMGVALERISLGALIIALGMLVDNAIVVVDGILVRQQKGIDSKKAASEVVAQSGGTAARCDGDRHPGVRLHRNLPGLDRRVLPLALSGRTGLAAALLGNGGDRHAAARGHAAQAAEEEARRAEKDPYDTGFYRASRAS